MLKFQRVIAMAFIGRGRTDAEARSNQVRRIRKFADDMEAGKLTTDSGVQGLYDGEPGGGGPCVPAVQVVAHVRLDVPLAEDRDDDHDD